ncbi:scaffold protein salvador isoform X2 [Musca autumnalis]|uniref:scaffold protein salvador isoform X2 n=1 Tax=Musca autumnalis TaxID=221902 RepID=UPI003CF9B508
MNYLTILLCNRKPPTMLSRKKDKNAAAHKEGVVGKYVKKDTPPEIPVINVWSFDDQRTKQKSKTLQRCASASPSCDGGSGGTLSGRGRSGSVSRNTYTDTQPDYYHARRAKSQLPPSTSSMRSNLPPPQTIQPTRRMQPQLQQQQSQHRHQFQQQYQPAVSSHSFYSTNNLDMAGNHNHLASSSSNYVNIEQIDRMRRQQSSPLQHSQSSYYSSNQKHANSFDGHTNVMRDRLDSFQSNMLQLPRGATPRPQTPPHQHYQQQHQQQQQSHHPPLAQSYSSESYPIYENPYRVSNTLTPPVHEREGLPVGWRTVVSNVHGTYYENQYTGQCQRQHPCLTSYYVYTTSAEPPKAIRPETYTPPAHTHNALVPANPYLLEEIPKWLVVYSEADSSKDHMLQFNMFSLQELECFDGMLVRLFKQELGTIVGFYERYRRALILEKNRRAEQERYLQELHAAAAANAANNVNPNSTSSNNVSNHLSQQQL